MIRTIYDKIISILTAEHDRLILWAPVCMSAGIAVYFTLKSEPPWWLGFASLCLSLAAILLFKRFIFLRYLFTAVALVAFGLTLSQFRTLSIHSPVLDAPVSYVEIAGKIAEIEPTPKGSKILLQYVTLSKVPPEKTPRFVSVTLKSYDPNMVTGQEISLRGGLFPPPSPAVPGGFDFGRYFYFREIGAVGFGFGPITTKSLKDSGASDFDIWFAEFRHRLTESIRSNFREPAGAVAAAFITGETQAIPAEINDNMRIAGLYHLLAVSGMNLSVVAGIAFFSLRFLLASIPPIALRYNIKKWAAFLALIVSYIYLRVSGSPVSAERAFFMVALIFIAILLDREPMPMRSVAIAAFCIALYEPEAVLTASFQLSFSATAALIASYEWGMGWLTKRQEGFGFARIAFYFAAVIVTSLVAWIATEPFIIYHFNQFSSYSLVANTIAEPLVSFLLMPLVIAGVLLLPFHLAWIAFAPMQYGVDLLLKIANWTASLPHAMWIVPNPTDYGFGVAVFGGLWIYFWKTRLRWLGVLLVLAGMSTAFSYLPPDIIVSEDGKHILVRLDNGNIAMLKGRSTSFIAGSWAKTELKQEQDYIDKDGVPMNCDDKGCLITLRGKKLSVLKDSTALSDECSLSDIVIINEPVDRNLCNAMVIDEGLLSKNGGAALWIKKGEIVIKQTRPEQGKRPWSN